VLYVSRLGSDLEHRQAIAFTTLALAQMASCLACRSETKLIAEIGWFGNWRLLAAVALTVLGQMLVIYWPPLQRMFDTVALSRVELVECFGAALVVFLVAELEKIIFRPRRRGATPAAPA